MATGTVNLPSVIGSGGGDLANFLSKKQKAVGTFATAGILGGLGFAAYHVAPIALKAFEVVTLGMANGIVTGIKFGSLGVLLFILLQKKTWTIFHACYGALSRKATKVMFNVLETDVLRWIAEEYLQEKYNTFLKASAFVEGKRDRTKGIRDQNDETIDECLTEAQGLQAKFYKNEVWSNEDAQARYRILSDKIEMLRNSNKKLEKTLQRQELYCKALAKWGRGYLIQMESTRNLVEVLETEYEASKGMAECSAAFSAVLPGSDMGQIFTASVEACKEKITQYNAQAEQFARMLPQLMADPDMKSDVNEANLLLELQKWDQRADDSLSIVEDEKRQIQQGGAAGVAGLIVTSSAPVRESVPATPRKSYLG